MSRERSRGQREILSLPRSDTPWMPASVTVQLSGVGGGGVVRLKGSHNRNIFIWEQIGDNFFGCTHNLSGLGQLLSCHSGGQGVLLKVDIFTVIPQFWAVASVPGRLGGQTNLTYIRKRLERLFFSQRLFKPRAGQGALNNGVSNGER